MTQKRGHDDQLILEQRSTPFYFDPSLRNKQYLVDLPDVLSIQRKRLRDLRLDTDTNGCHSQPEFEFFSSSSSIKYTLLCFTPPN